MENVAVEVGSIEKTYKSGFLGARQVHALKGVSFQVECGEIFGLLGPNGAGKTTLIKILLGIVMKSSGNASLFGIDAGKQRARTRVGYLPEHYRIPRHHTAQTAMSYYGALCDVPGELIRRRSRELLELVGLGGKAKLRVSTFSKGMKQRLGLALAMIHDPDLLILDEPTDGVDPVGRSDMRDLFVDLKRRGKTIFLNSHLLQETELVCDRVAILDQGILRQLATVKELTMKANSTVITILGRPTDVESVFGGGVLAGSREIGDGATELYLNIHEQDLLDDAVDALRKGQFSIVGIKQESRSLEQAFMQIVKGQN